MSQKLVTEEQKLIDTGPPSKRYFVPIIIDPFPD